MTIFADRRDAGRKLSLRLMHLKVQAPVVLALPRGGVPVAFEVARALEAPLDLVMVRKIGVPWQPELAAAAVVDGDEPQIVENAEVTSSLGVDHAYIETEGARQLKEIARRRALYLKGRSPIALRDRAVILVDDGIATGATARAALKGARKAGAATVVLAVPVAPGETIALLRGEADEVICLTQPPHFGGISQFYVDFHQVCDEEVIDLLKAAAAFGPQRTQPGMPSTA